MYSNLHCKSYQCNDRWSPLCVATVVPFSRDSPSLATILWLCYPMCDRVIMHDNLATTLLPKWLRLLNNYIYIYLYIHIYCHLSTYLYNRRNSAQLINSLASSRRSLYCSWISVGRLHPAVYYCISVSSFLHSLVKYKCIFVYSYNKFIFVVVAYAILFSCVMVIEVVGVLYWKIYGLTSQPLTRLI